MSVLVLDLENTLLADDGAAAHVVRQLAGDRATTASLHPIDGGTLGFRLMAMLVDAAQLGETAATLRQTDSDALTGHLTRGGRISAHEAGLIDLLTPDGWTPAHLALLCIQPRHVDWGEQLSEPVTRALPAACRTVVQTVLAWQ